MNKYLIMYNIAAQWIRKIIMGDFLHNKEEAAATDDNMEEAATNCDSANNTDYSVWYAVNVVLHN